MVTNYTQSSQTEKAGLPQAIQILNNYFRSDFEPTTNTQIDYENCVDISDGKINIAFRHLNDKYGHELTIKSQSSTANPTELDKLMNGKCKADYHLFTFFHDDPTRIVSWVLVDTKKMIESLPLYLTFNYEAKVNEKNKSYKFIKLRLLYLRLCGCLIKWDNITNTQSYGINHLNGADKELLFFERAISQAQQDKINKAMEQGWGEDCV